MFPLNSQELLNFSEEIVIAVNHVLPKFYLNFQFQNLTYFYNLQKKINNNGKMFLSAQNDRIILCEFDVGLWEKSLISAINCLGSRKYLSHKIIQKFMNYLLNGYPYTDFGLLEDFYHRLLIVNPPKLDSINYYKAILCEPYLTVNGKYTEEQGMFEWLLEALFNCLNDSSLIDVSEVACNTIEKSVSSILEDNFHNEILNNSFTFLNKKNIIYYDDLFWRDKFKRCLRAMNFIYNIFEANFVFFINSENSKRIDTENERPFLSHFLWQDKRSIGLCNKLVNRIIKIFILGSQLEDQNFLHLNVTKKFLNLLAEVTRLCDIEEKIKYPHLGTKSNDLARELSIQLFELLQNCEKFKFSKLVPLIQSLKSSWFRLLLCSYLLGFITGCHCSPELSTVCDILSKMVFTIQKNEIEKETNTKSNSSIDWNRVKKLRNRSSINMKYKGRTRLQASCDINDAEEVKALLTFPELDINGADMEGWTALHIACAKGSEDCVRMLLFGLPSELKKSINTRAKGPKNYTPIMCAIEANHLEICHLLLQHTGSALLEDINDDNKTAVDLSKNVEITRLLSYYKSNCSSIQFKGLQTMKLDERCQEIVLDLCSELLQSYFITYRTWDVCKALKTQREQNSLFTIKEDLDVCPDWNYKQYEKDIVSNIPRLKELNSQLSNLHEFKLTNVLSNFRLLNL